MQPKLLLAGLGETGSELARKLSINWELVAVDFDEAAVAAARVGIPPDGAIETHVGDATSALVLKRSGAQGAHAAVACLGSDEANREFLRLAHFTLDIHNRFALMYSLSWEDLYHADNVEVVSQDHACAAILESRIQRGHKVASGVGLGEGEIIEVEVLPNSSVVGRSLSELGPRRWLVGAVYRSGKLVVPHGDTVLEPGDKVLLIGDPEILPSIATLIRTGESEFPLQYGSNVVTLCQPGVERVLPEAQYLIADTRAELFEAIACQAEERGLNQLLGECAAREIPYEFSCSAEGSVESLVEESKRQDVGVLIVPPEPLPWLARVGLGRSGTVRIIDLLSSPVLVSRCTFPYRRVMLAMAEVPFHPSAAHLAIDVVRKLGAQLHLAVVHQPDIVEGVAQRETLERQRRDVENLAGMYHVKMESFTLEGNPIHELVKASENFDLMVLPYRRGRRGSLTRPDVGLNLIHRARCSVMVMPH